MTKSELRNIYLEKRRNFAADDLVTKSHRIAGHFFENCELSAVRNLHCFIPITKFHEIDTAFIYERIWRHFPQIQTVVPRVDLESGDIVHVVYTHLTKLVENKWGIREPANGDLVDAAEIDLVIVPLLCFDTRGNRIGYGNGFYDRFLSKCRQDCVKIGLSYFPPVAKIVDAREHDVRLDFCVTPDLVFEFGTKKDAAEL